MKALIIVSLMTLPKWTVPTQTDNVSGGFLRNYLKEENQWHASCHFNCALTAIYHGTENSGEDFAGDSGPLDRAVNVSIMTKYINPALIRKIN